MTEGRKIIPIIRPVLGEPEAEAVRRTLSSHWVTQGPQVAAFETEFAAHVSAKHACAVSSCTAGLHLALLAVGVKPGDEVITASHSYIATANSIRYCGALPVFVDIDPRTFNMDPARIEAVISSRTRAILCIHQMGMPCDLRRILESARRHDLSVVEDAACAVGSEILWNGSWEPLGKPRGDIATFSFHPRKVITTGDGGMVTTNHADYDKKVRLLRQHAMSVPDTERHQSRQVTFEKYLELGYNYRMTDIQAAVGRSQLKRLPGIVTRRRELAAKYTELLQDIPGLLLPHEPHWARSNWQSYCVRLPEHVDQVAVMQSMLDDGVATRRGIMCAHREPAYPEGTWSAENPADPSRCLRESETAQDRTIVLPLYHQMADADQKRVTAALRTACNA